MWNTEESITRFSKTITFYFVLFLIYAIKTVVNEIILSFQWKYTGTFNSIKQFVHKCLDGLYGLRSIRWTYLDQINANPVFRVNICAKETMLTIIYCFNDFTKTAPLFFEVCFKNRSLNPLRLGVKLNPQNCP